MGWVGGRADDVDCGGCQRGMLLQGRCMRALHLPRARCAPAVVPTYHVRAPHHVQDCTRGDAQRSLRRREPQERAPKVARERARGSAQVRLYTWLYTCNNTGFARYVLYSGSALCCPWHCSFRDNLFDICLDFGQTESNVEEMSRHLPGNLGMTMRRNVTSCRDICQDILNHERKRQTASELRGADFEKKSQQPRLKEACDRRPFIRT